MFGSEKANEYMDRMINKLHKELAETKDELRDTKARHTLSATEQNNMLNDIHAAFLEEQQEHKAQKWLSQSLGFVMCVFFAMIVLLIFCYHKQEKAFFGLQDKYQQLQNQYNYEHRKLESGTLRK